MSDHTSVAVAAAFIIMLSSKKDVTFTISDVLMQAFPFEDFELVASRDEIEGTTTFTLKRIDEQVH